MADEIKKAVNNLTLNGTKSSRSKSLELLPKFPIKTLVDFKNFDENILAVAGFQEQLVRKIFIIGIYSYNIKTLFIRKHIFKIWACQITLR